MKQNDRKKLDLIEGIIERGEEFCLLRILDQRSGKWKKVISMDKEIVQQGLGEPRGLLDNLLANFAYESASLRRAVDLREISDSDNNLAVKIALERVQPKLKLVVFGGGHVGQAVALIGAILGYDLVLVDDRPEFASRKRFPDNRIKLVVGHYAEISKDIKVKTNAAIVIVTRGHQFDEVCLRNVIRSNAAYLGMIGSKRRTISIINRLKMDGFSDVDFSRLHAPIGLQIGARSPQEIAVAIHAEIISHFNKSNSE